jgi:hypothetical protein
VKRILCLATGLSLFVSVSASARCASPSDETIFELQGLKSALVVLALSCRLDERYNGFVHRYISTLGQDEKDFSAYFRRTFGNAGQREQDNYITLLANADAAELGRQGTDYCGRNTVMFDEVMALRTDADLVPYAAGKDLMPDTAPACPAPVHAVATSSRSSTTRSSAAKKH